MTIFTVRYDYDARSSVRDEVRPEHRRYLSGLHDAGTLLSSGPFTGPPSSTADGEAADAAEGAMLIMRGDTVAAVLAQLDQDPFHLGGLIADRTVQPWKPVIGTWSED